MSVRSALNRVRWNDMPVRREASSVEGSPDTGRAAVSFIAVSRSGDLIRLGPDDAAEPEMARGSVDRLGKTGRRTVAPAIVRRAQVRASFDDLSGNPNFRLARIVAVRFAGAPRIAGNTTGFHDFVRVLGWYQSVVHSHTLPIMS